MKYIEMLKELKKGKKVRQKGWNENCYIFKTIEGGVIFEYNPYINRTKLYSPVVVDIERDEWELYDKNPVLTAEEKRYLWGVIKPFKDKVMYIYKRDLFDEGKQYLVFNLKDEDDCALPCFKKGAMYKNMELDKAYTLKELGLFVGD